MPPQKAGQREREEWEKDFGHHSPGATVRRHKSKTIQSESFWPAQPPSPFIRVCNGDNTPSPVRSIVVLWLMDKN
ncbi:hypothetical protein ZHAS_00008846 [Anopheles sinensis]|uniref:Uncharacterized protein n=1 Tax=Anopheles sinensis TaxID=74873 RepID=A0A084VTG2_ANOSI|nr:hypothetical protein ZHAS_00008846 [Anopheles sinensis]